MDTTLPAPRWFPPMMVPGWRCSGGPRPAPPPVARVLVVHGLGEHSGRHANVVAALVREGWEVVAYDQRGHGRSEGRARRAAAARRPAARPRARDGPRARARERRRPAATPPLPALRAQHGGTRRGAVRRARAPAGGRPDPLLARARRGLSLAKRVQLAIGHTFLPDLSQPNRLDVERISHDPAVVRAYRDDPLVHDRVTARLARAIVDGGAEVLERAPGWRVPTLLLWAGADAFVAPAGSAAFAHAAPGAMVHDPVLRRPLSRDLQRARPGARPRRTERLARGTLPARECGRPRPRPYGVTRTSRSASPPRVLRTFAVNVASCPAGTRTRIVTTFVS